jgi:hypothetical protein
VCCICQHLETAEADPGESAKPLEAPTSSKRHGSRKRRSAKRSSNHVFVRPGKVPAEVFLGRRGMYPVAPGLEEYVQQLRSQTLRAVEAEEEIKRAKDRRDTSTAYAKSMRADVMSRKDASERTRLRDEAAREEERLEKVRKAEVKKGLLIRFKINVGFRKVSILLYGSDVAWCMVPNRGLSWPTTALSTTRSSRPVRAVSPPREATPWLR